MLDMIVLIAMAVTAVAFAVGLVLHSGIAQIPALIAAAALYMVMAASYLMVARTPKSSGGGSDRINELEAALEVIDKDLQRIDKVEDDVSRLDLLTDRIDRLDQAMTDYGTGDRGGESSRFAGMTQEIEAVHAKIETLRADLEGEARTHRDKIASELKGLEAMIKQLSQDLVDAPDTAAARPPSRTSRERVRDGCPPAGPRPAPARRSRCPRRACKRSPRRWWRRAGASPRRRRRRRGRCRCGRGGSSTDRGRDRATP